MVQYNVKLFSYVNNQYVAYIMRLLWNLELMWITHYIICWYGVLLNSTKL